GLWRERDPLSCGPVMYNDDIQAFGAARHLAQPINPQLLVREALSSEEWNLWREFIAGKTQQELAVEYGISAPTISRRLRQTSGPLEEIDPALLVLLGFGLVALKIIFGKSEFSREDGSLGKAPVKEYEYVYSQTGKPRSLPQRHALPP